MSAVIIKFLYGSVTVCIFNFSRYDQWLSQRFTKIIVGTKRLLQFILSRKKLVGYNFLFFHNLQQQSE